MALLIGYREKDKIMQAAEMFLLFVAGVVALSSAQAPAGSVPGTLDWCQYWRLRGIPKPECNGVVTTQPTTSKLLLLFSSSKNLDGFRYDNDRGIVYISFICMFHFNLIFGDEA